jgi:hypothetical protein
MIQFSILASLMLFSYFRFSRKTTTVVIGKVSLPTVVISKVSFDYCYLKYYYLQLRYVPSSFYLSCLPLLSIRYTICDRYCTRIALISSVPLFNVVEA